MSRIKGTRRERFHNCADIDKLSAMQNNKLKEQANRHDIGACVAMMLGSKPRYPLCPCYSDEKQCYDCLCKVLNEKVN